MQDSSVAPLPAGFPEIIWELFQFSAYSHAGHVWATRTRLLLWIYGVVTQVP